MADRSDREQGQPTECPRRHSLNNRMGPRSRTPSGPAVSTDCINRPDRRLHPTIVTTSNYLLQRGGHPQRTSYLARKVLFCSKWPTRVAINLTGPKSLVRRNADGLPAATTGPVLKT